jgi:nifR3 family TIM-barrel protein
MAGITDRSFRLMLRRMGGVGLVSMEFISARQVARSDARVEPKLRFSPEERPLAIQIYGSRAEDMAEAAERVEAMGADVCDVNMGCPANKVLKGCAGAALMRDLREAERMIATIRRRISIPLTVKFRAGIGTGATPVNYLELGRLCEANGVDAVALHPRTAKQRFTGEADWSRIRALKEALDIPIVGNGDVRTPEDVVRMMRETGCDGVMIGRATLTNPWIFRQSAALLRGRNYARPTLEDRRDLILGHFRALAAEGDRRLTFHKLRTFLGWYTRGLPGGIHLRRRLNAMVSPEEVIASVESFFERAIAA